MQAGRQTQERADRTRSKHIPELWAAKDLKALLKIDVKTVYSYVQRGLIYYVCIRSNVCFDKTEIVHWPESQTYRPTRPDPQSTASRSAPSSPCWR